MPSAPSRPVRPLHRWLDAANWTTGSLAAFLLATCVWAASPHSGTLAPASTTPLAWVGTAPGTGAQAANASNETACIDSGPTQNCDTYTLTIAPGSYAGKVVNIAVSWKLLTDEYDLFVHQGGLTGPLVASSTNGASGSLQPATTNAVGLLSPAPGTYTVHVAYATTPGAGPANTDQYKGTAAVAVNTNKARLAYYQYGGFTFGTDVPLKAPVTNGDSEPGLRVDTFGNAYASGIRGFPAGVDAWYLDLNPHSPNYDPYLRNPLYRGQPDGFTGSMGTGGLEAGGDGGGDIDLAVGFPADGSTPVLAFASLIAANVSVGKSTDKGQTFLLNSAGNITGGIPGDDRQWLEAFGPNTIYLIYRTLEPAVTQIQRSDDGGLTYGPASTAGQIGQVGALDVDPTDGTVFLSGGNGVVAVGTPSIPGQAPLSTDYKVYPVASDPNGVAHLFFQVQVAKDAGSLIAGKNGHTYGTVYACYSNDYDVFIEHSLDRGKTWSAPVKVDGPGLGTITHVFPRLALGPKYGSVGVVWYGTSDKGRTPNSVGSNAAEWRVYYGLTTNATAANPTFRDQVASSHVNHAGNISEGGLVTPPAPNPNRNLGDYFELAYDPQGAATIAYGDDHNDFSGNAYAVHQVGGPGIGGTSVLIPSEGNVLPPPPPAGPPPAPADGSQVTDFAQDQSGALVVKTPANSPIDVLAIKYAEANTPQGLTLTATMRVSDLSMIPTASTWKMDFTANAPLASTTPAGSLFSNGVSDLGDQLYLEAATDTKGAMTYTYGTAIRNSDGSLTYTPTGSADAGSFDTKNNLISVRVFISKLNKLVTHGPALGHGSILCGLRGDTSGASSGAALSDTTYGGTQYKLP